MITKNFQKLGALVASLVGILTLSSAAEAITFTTFTSPGGAILGKTASTASQEVTTAEITNPLTINFVKSVTINGLNIEKNARRLSGTLSLRDALGNDIVAPVALFSSNGALTATGGVITNGSFTFIDTIASSWPGATGTYPASPSYPAGTYGSVDSFSVFNDLDLNGTHWAFNLTNAANGSSGTASFTNFSVNAAVPFESNAAPAGVAIVFGAFVLRRKLQQRSARMMSLESVNS
ncbi:hypothetical protein HGD76_03730 [Dolichospermum flos-aquae CCAP 1403/13F]|uniref:PEP-CTERM sorting domain-containing protein n=2 Tax=Dolichospermum flosaquae TaxID=1166 RepID=A0A6H2BV53_DOLFA|nr:hypothetical protein HGD76_03730 [Dolichospermum flos-aquae CCAP 1403/13F]